MRKLIVLAWILILSSAAYSAGSLDSLRILLRSEKMADTTRVNILNQIADIFEEKAVDSCVFYGRQALELARSVNYFQGCGKAYNTIGSYYNSKGDYKQALNDFIEGYKIYEKLGNKKAMSNLMNSMGNTYMGIQANNKALEAYRKSYELASLDSAKYMMGISSVGIGNVLLLQKDAQQALECFIRAKEVFQNTPNAVYPLALSYSLIGNAYVEMNEFEKAFSNFDRAVEELKTLNNTYGIAGTYQVIGDAWKRKGNLDKALDYFLMSYNVFTERQAYDDLKNVSLHISEIYQEKGEFEKALLYYTKYNAFKDSVFNAENNRQLLEVGTKYETEKKQQQIEVQGLILKEQQFQRNVLIGSIVLVFLVLLLLYNRYSVKQKANKSLSQANLNLELKNAIIGQKNSEITDSINYARRIQYALLANTIIFEQNFAGYFVFFKPKDIVSGDFYWATSLTNENNEDLFFLACCDSTGHGVPGAFMSLLSIGFLSEAIKERNIHEPNKVLDFVRSRLIESISSDGQQDGFDGILLCINKATGIITYAAANNSSLLVSGTEAISLESDKMPVGKGEKTKDFSLFELAYKSGDSLYLYTDGYPDQFGGPKGKKFKYKQLEELLLANVAKPMDEQQIILKTTLENWQNNLEQVDDVCVMGLRL